MAVVALTMNPAIDVSAATDIVAPTDKLRCRDVRREPGGGGINVARVVAELGGEAVAVFPAGGVTGQLLQALLGERPIAQHAVPAAAETRQSFTVDEAGSGLQYRFVLPGESLTQAEQESCLQHLAAVARKGDLVVASGSLPAGVPASFFAQVCSVCDAAGVRLILDTSGDALRHARCAYLVKPNLNELQALAGTPLTSTALQQQAARRLIDEHVAEVVLLSLGADGALLVTADEARHLPAPQVTLRSAVGAGDSMVAGLALALSQGAPLVDAVRRAMAAGAAALITPGSGLARRADVERLYREIVAAA